MKRAIETAWRWAEAVPLRIKIIGMVIGISCFIGAISVYLVKIGISEELSRQLRERSCSAARELASRATEYILLNDRYNLTRLLKDAVKNRPDLRYAFVLTLDGKVLAHSFEGGFPTDLLKIKYRKFQDKESPRALHTNEGPVWECMAPIMNGDLGVVKAGVSTTRAGQALKGLVVNIALTTILTAVLGILGASFLTFLIVNPVKKLLEGTKRIESGDYSVRLPSGPGDEIGKLVTAFNTMATKLEEARRDRMDREAMRKRFLQAVIRAQEEERSRFSRELHDQVGQFLASIKIDLKLIEKARDKKELYQRIERLRSTLSTEIEAIRALSLELRPRILDDMGLKEALENYARAFSKRHGIDVDLIFLGFDGKRPPPEYETCLYRICQEALSNVARHARARSVTIILEKVGKEIRAVIDDDGIGFDKSSVEPHKLGLYGMSERVALRGGKFHIESKRGRGTTISFSMPLGEQKGHEA